jgi:hypothetical protein
MQYDPLIEILQVAEESVVHPAKSAVLRNLQILLRQDPNLSRELGKRIATVLRESHCVPLTAFELHDGSAQAQKSRFVCDQNPGLLPDFRKRQ